MKYKAWKTEVDKLFLRKTGCSWADLCGDEAPLDDSYRAIETPAEFVDRYIEKYDLTTKE